MNKILNGLLLGICCVSLGLLLFTYLGINPFERHISYAYLDTSGNLATSRNHHITIILDTDRTQTIIVHFEKTIDPHNFMLKNIPENITAYYSAFNGGNIGGCNLYEVNPSIIALLQNGGQFK